MTMIRTSRTATAAALALSLLLLPLAGCAPEPGSSGTGDPIPTEKQPPEGGSWPEENPDEVFEKHQDIPDDFPEGFIIPEGAAIDDVGSRGYGTWYLVLRADTEVSASALWDEVIAGGAFTVSEESTTVEGGKTATLENGELSALAVTMPSDDETVLLSYDITSTVA